MAYNSGDVWDSQILSENVVFLEHCFENSFTVLQSSIGAVKEHLAEEDSVLIAPLKCNKINKSNETIQCDISLCNRSEGKRCGSINITNLKNNGEENSYLSNWGLPQGIVKNYEMRGITKMFDWQITCLSNQKVLMDFRNLVYSAPTSAGKTLIAEIITIKTILERQKKVIVILPFVSIVREKMFYLQNILSSSGIRVEGFVGSQNLPGGINSVHVAICTIEKANSLINRLLDDGSISELGAVIVDELHLLGDPNRGYILELLLSKIKYVSTTLDDTLIQIVGMSATLPNLEVLANWLDAELFITQFRPIPLNEYCLVGNKYYNKNGEYVDSQNEETLDGDSVLKICLDTIGDGCSVLIFCMTKNRCENVAQSLSSTFYKIGCSNSELGTILRNQLKSELILEVLEQLKNCPVGLDHILKSAISFGVAFHHAGLTFDERDIIEGGFKSGAIRVLVATSTLSSGVNLPARKVIVRSPVFQRQPINILTYKQMIGRAGRMGKDTKGESILICTESEKKIGLDLMMGDLLPVKSCIDAEDKFMRTVLEMIASQIVCTESDLQLYSKCTLLFTQNEKRELHENLLSYTLKELVNYELVRVQSKENLKHYTATPLGKACLSSSMAPNDGLSLFCELQKARQCLVLETDLHLIYLVTPYSVSNQWGEIDWLHLLTLWESLTRSMKRVGELIGVQESFIIRNLRGGSKQPNSNNKLNIHKRFYTALALQDLVNEIPLSEVATKFQCPRGFLQSLQQASATFAGMVTAFCRQLGWKNMEMLISQFQDRLHFGIHSELLELMKLPSLNGVRARGLFSSGFDSVTSIASGDVDKIVNALHKSVPFQSEKGGNDEESEDIRKRNKMKNMWITGYCAMTVREAAQKLILEARKYLEFELGVSQIKWDKNRTNNVEHAKEEEPQLAMGKGEMEPLKLYDSQSDFINMETAEGHNKHIEHSSPNITLGMNRHDIVNGFDGNNLKSNTHSSYTNIDSEFVINGAENSNRSINCTNKNTEQDLQHVLNINHNLNSKNDDIIWDSLNFTEIQNHNVTKMRNSRAIFSPNFSFCETDLKDISKIIDSKTEPNSKVTSKDLSLFSSEGDNSSIFEDSLPLDLIPSKLFDNNLSKEKSFCTTNVPNTVLNEFKSNCIDDDEEPDMKLYYEEDNKPSDKVCDIAFGTTIDIEEINTQDVKNMSFDPSFISPLKRHKKYLKENKSTPPTKKMKHSCSIFLNKNSNVLENTMMPVLKNCSSKKIELKIANYKLKCFILREDDISHNLHIFNNINNIAIYLELKNKITPLVNVIGRNILRPSNRTEDIDEPSYTNICDIKSITFCYKDICYVIDMSSLNSKSVFSLKECLKDLFRKQDLKWKYLSLQAIFTPFKLFFNFDLPLPYVDISLVQWLIDSEEKTGNLFYLAKKYCNIDLATVSIWDDDKEIKFKNLGSNQDSCLRGWLIWTVAEKLNDDLLKQYNNVKNIFDIEARVLKILSKGQYYGVTVDKKLASDLLIDVKNAQDAIQKQAFQFCGYHFNFNSSKDVAKVLGLYKGRKVSTKKSVLSAHKTPISSLVIYWRKLNSILTKTLYPLTEKACIYSEGDRINPSYTMYTCTGRVSMHEPNLQNVPRTFSIPIKYLSKSENEDSRDVIEFNCRNIFRAAPGYVLVSADYCQLEMRILTHYSEDPVLTEIMRSNVDVFKSIASSWGGIPEEDVDDDLRQKAKQLCYGILYGMGNKTLAQHLDVTEIESAMFMDTFFKTYPAIRTFTQSVIENCRKNSYVETLTKRRRYLPDIKSLVPSKRSAAERQAVNTTIQGSAADVAKAAMCAIDMRTEDVQNKPNLFLQMHDELIYEVPVSYQQTFISIMKEVMEGTVKLKVPLPVKVRAGQSWGALEEIKII